MGLILRIAAVALAMCMLTLPLTVKVAGQQVRPYADWKGCNYEYGMDHIGSDGYVGTYYARSEQECCQMCFYDVRCHAFTWWSTSEPGNSYGVKERCYFKTFLGPARPNSRVVAGTLKSK